MSNHLPRFIANLSFIALAIASFASTAQAGDLAYVTNERGGVSVIALANFSTLKEINVGAHNPRGLGVSADGKIIVTANKKEGNISVIEASSGKVLQHIPIGKNPEFVRVYDNKAYVTYEPSASTGAPKTESTKKEGKESEEAVPGHIAVVDLLTGKQILDIVGKPETEGIEFSMDGKLMLVTNESDNSISVHDRLTGTLLKTVSLAKYGFRPRGIKVSPDGKTYLTTLELSDKLIVLDQDFNVVKEVATANIPYGVAYDAVGKRVYVAANRSKVLQVFDAKTFEKIKDIPTDAERCWHFTTTPDTHNLLLACGKSNEVVVIDTDKLEVKQRITGMNLPWGIVSYPKAMGSLDRP